MKRREPPDPPSPDELMRMAEELDLTALRDALGDLLAHAEQASPSYTDFALGLLRTEWTARQERKLTRGLKRSRLGTVEGIDTFDFAARPQLEPRVIKELLNCRFIDEKRNIICVGRPGLGIPRNAVSLGVPEGVVPGRGPPFPEGDGDRHTPRRRRVGGTGGTGGDRGAGDCGNPVKGPDQGDGRGPNLGV